MSRINTDAAVARLEEAVREDRQVSEKLRAACSVFRSHFLEGFTTAREEISTKETLTRKDRSSLRTIERIAAGTLNDISKLFEKRTAKATKAIRDFEKLMQRFGLSEEFEKAIASSRTLDQK